MTFTLLVSAAEKINSRIQTEEQLLKNSIGFTATFLCLQHLDSNIQALPDTITQKTGEVLLHVIRSSTHEHKKQAYFLYKTAAQALISISKNHIHSLAGFLIIKLQELLLTSTGNKHRAVSEALGDLPLNIEGPTIDEQKDFKVFPAHFDQLLDQFGFTTVPEMKWVGRTLVCTGNDGKTGCIKFIRKSESKHSLSCEILWLQYLNKNADFFDKPFKIPLPIFIDGHHLFKLDGFPDRLPVLPDISNDFTAMAFLAHHSYFHYPNLPEFSSVNQSSEIIRIFGLNARLLGSFVSKGIIHTALIPLFHNRVQQSRRQDRGRYRWEQGGRLDQWLKSSQYPNFASSGLRDFEHLISISNSKQIRHFIGEHLLAFILVAGSFFRNKAPEKIGYDDKNQPLDLRELFDKKLFSQIIQTVIHQYYLGVTGCRLKQIDRLFNSDLIDHLIQAMGIDHHMEEILRLSDQENMTDQEFLAFLMQRGLSEKKVRTLKKAHQDIVLQTGPHLGGFNQPIHPPELISFLFCLSSLCVSDWYLMENGLKADLN